jgi:hypothetical protein
MSKTHLSLIVGFALLLGGCSILGSPPTTSDHLVATSAPELVQTTTPSPSEFTMPSNGPTESGCAQEGHIKSPSSFDKATITFDNQTAGDMKVYWIDFQGKRKFYSELKAHSKYDQATWVGHVWVVADASDQCVKLESANAVDQILEIP